MVGREAGSPVRTQAKSRQARHRPEAAVDRTVFAVILRGSQYLVINQDTGGIFGAFTQRDWEKAQRRVLELEQTIGRSRRAYR
jgi:hypothetical protein